VSRLKLFTTFGLILIWPLQTSYTCFGTPFIKYYIVIHNVRPYIIYIYIYVWWVCIATQNIYTSTDTHTCARIPFAHTHEIHFCTRTYFHTFVPTYMRCTSTRLGVLSNSADGRRACAFGVCACVRGKSTAASSSANTAKTREMKDRWIINS